MANTQVRKTPRRYAVSQGSKPDGLDLPAGTYPGYSKELGLHTLGGLSWTSPTHHLEISHATLASIPGFQGLMGMEIDVTREVGQGTVKVV